MSPIFAGAIVLSALLIATPALSTEIEKEQAARGNGVDGFRIDAGDVLLLGTIEWWRDSHTDTSNDDFRTTFDATSIMFIPEMSYFLTPSISVGGALELVHQSGNTSIDDGDLEDYKSTTWKLEGRARYNFIVNDRLLPYAGAHVGWGRSSLHTGDTTLDGSFLNYGIQAGALIPLSDRLFLAPGLKHSWYRYDFTSDAYSSEVRGSVTQAWSIFLGIKL
jgi:long-subunit fatty acid transport protein